MVGEVDDKKNPQNMGVPPQYLVEWKKSGWCWVFNFGINMKEEGEAV